MGQSANMFDEVEVARLICPMGCKRHLHSSVAPVEHGTLQSAPYTTCFFLSNLNAGSIAAAPTAAVFTYNILSCSLISFLVMLFGLGAQSCITSNSNLSASRSSAPPPYAAMNLVFGYLRNVPAYNISISVRVVSNATPISGIARPCTGGLYASGCMSTIAPRRSSSRSRSGDLCGHDSYCRSSPNIKLHSILFHVWSIFYLSGHDPENVALSNQFVAA
jgi:hypothetical protein